MLLFDLIEDHISKILDFLPGSLTAYLCRDLHKIWCLTIVKVVAGRGEGCVHTTLFVVFKSVFLMGIVPHVAKLTIHVVIQVFVVLATGAHGRWAFDFSEVDSICVPYTECCNERFHRFLDYKSG